MLTAASGLFSGNEVPAYQSNRTSAQLQFNQENFVNVVIENLRLQKELNEALQEVLDLKKELNREFVETQHLRIA